MTSSQTCSGRAVASTSMALIPPVSAMSGTIGPRFMASARLIAQAVSVEPVKATPATFGCAVKAAPKLAIARQEQEHILRHPCFIEQFCGLKCDEWRLFRRLCDDRISGKQGCADLTKENRQREIPGRDANEHAPAAMTVPVFFAGRSRHQAAISKLSACFLRIVAAKIDSLSDLRNPVRQTFASLNGQDGHQPVAVFLQKIPDLCKDFSALFHGAA
jgi:hypothetical protein